VVLLAHGQSRPVLVRRWLERLPPGTVTMLAEAVDPRWGLAEWQATSHAVADLSGIDDYLCRYGPVDAVVDLRPVPLADHFAAWRTVAYHLMRGGAYALDTRAGQVDPHDPELARRLADLVRMRDNASELPTAVQRELGRAIGFVHAYPRVVIIETRLRHLLKLHDAEADSILATREPHLQVDRLHVVPARPFEPASRIHSHGARGEIKNLPTRFDAPALHLRHYAGDITLVSNSLLHTRDTALPDSFRHHLQENLRNPVLVNSGGPFARVPRRFAARRTLEGTYFDLDSENSGHFGHLTTEVISRLWGWDRAKERYPDLKAIMRIRFAGEREPELERRMFAAYGIAPDDLVVVDEPVRLSSVVAATPMFHNAMPHYVHPDLPAVWRRISEGLAPTATPPNRRLFVSRRMDRKNRNCRNTPEVEEYFTAAGFEIVYPERHDLAEQARLFAEAEVVAGFGGSGMFNVLHCRGLKAMLVLTHEAYTARNELLFAAALEADLHYFWSRPDLEHPPGGWSEEAYYCDWEFDLRGNRAELDAVLERL
jgi:capsular polysaccharide biosynthesis protein